jgi:hypothetical protein
VFWFLIITNSCTSSWDTCYWMILCHMYKKRILEKWFLTFSFLNF